MVGQILGKERGDHFTLVFQRYSTFIGNANKNNCHIECGCEKID